MSTDDPSGGPGRPSRPSRPARPSLQRLLAGRAAGGRLSAGRRASGVRSAAADSTAGADPLDLSNHFLIAMPAMQDPNFGGTVVFLAEHNEKGALGLVVNRTIDMTMQALFEKVNLELEIGPIGAAPVFYGGPVQTDRGFVLHQPVGSWNSTLAVGGTVGLTSSKDILEAVARGDGPPQIMVTLGYAGWGPGQLENELAQNAWLTVKADPGLIFEVPVEDRLARAFALLGIDPLMLSDAAGHA